MQGESWWVAKVEGGRDTIDKIWIFRSQLLPRPSAVREIGIKDWKCQTAEAIPENTKVVGLSYDRLGTRERNFPLGSRFKEVVGHGMSRICDYLRS